MDHLSEPINREIGQQPNFSLQQPKRRNNFLPKFLPIILGIILIILSIEGVLLAVMKNNNKRSEAENPKKVEISEEKVTPVPTEIESSWKGKKTVLFQGHLEGFKKEIGELSITLSDGSVKMISVNPDTNFLYIDMSSEDSKQWYQKEVQSSTFWDELQKNESVSASCYDGTNLAVTVAKIINIKTTQ